MTEKIVPLRDYLLVKKSAAEKTAGGLILPNQVKTEGTVIAVGSKVSFENDNEKINVGDYVMYNEYAGTQLKHPDYPNDHILLMQEKDVYAIKR